MAEGFGTDSTQIRCKREHPDYETGEMKVEMKNLHRNRYLELSTLLMKRRFVLDEVVVTASIVKIA